MDVIVEQKTATLSVDFQSGFLLITWHGRVDFEEYKNVLTKARDIADVHGVRNVIINRLDLQELNTECRVWMKNHFLKEMVRPLIPKLSKVATIESRSAIGQIYSKTISKTVSLVYPNLSFKSFGSEIEAYKWFVDSEKETQETIDYSAQLAESDEALENRRTSMINSIYQLFFSWR